MEILQKQISTNPEVNRPYNIDGWDSCVFGKTYTGYTVN